MGSIWGAHFSEDSNLWRHPNPWVGVMGGLMGSGQITKNQINLGLIEIFILFEDSTSVEAPPTNGWVYGWVEG